MTDSCFINASRSVRFVGEPPLFLLGPASEKLSQPSFHLIRVGHKIQLTISADRCIYKRKSALFLNRNGARGGTDIRSPLLWALDVLNEAKSRDPSRVPFLILLTDGAVEGAYLIFLYFCRTYIFLRKKQASEKL